MKNSICVVLFAFSALTLSATDLKGKGEVDVFGGGAHTVTTPASGVHANNGLFGFSAGYGVASMVQIFGEYSYIPVGNDLGISAKTQNFGGGVKVNVVKSEKLDPYGLFELNGSRFSGDCTGCTSQTNKTLQIGGGVRIYVGKRWGVTPEIRWAHAFQDSGDTNFIVYAGGVFFQFGK